MNIFDPIGISEFHSENTLDLLTNDLINKPDITQHSSEFYSDKINVISKFYKSELKTVYSDTEKYKREQKDVIRNLCVDFQKEKLEIINMYEKIIRDLMLKHSVEKIRITEDNLSDTFKKYKEQIQSLQNEIFQMKIKSK